MAKPTFPTTPLRCLVVDDNPLAVQVLLQYIAATPGLQAVGYFSNAIDALTFLRTQPVEVLFMDVTIPQLSGIDLLRHLPKLPYTVLVAARENHAMRAFEYSVADYLLKPITAERFAQAAAKIVARVASAQLAPPEPKSAFTYVKVGHQLQQVVFADIHYLRVIRNYIDIIFKQHKLTICSTMQAFRELAPADLFFMPHRSFLVNIRYIDAIERGHLVMRDRRIPISARQRTQLLECINLL